MTRYEECLTHVKRYAESVAHAGNAETLIRSFVSSPAYDVTFQNNLVADALRHIRKPLIDPKSKAKQRPEFIAADDALQTLIDTHGQYYAREWLYARLRRMQDRTDPLPPRQDISPPDDIKIARPKRSRP